MDRTRAVAWFSFVYLGYLFLSEIPQVSGYPVFAIQAESLLLVILFFVSSFANWGLSKAGRFLVVASLISYAVEYVGTTTGYPFGNYSYTPALSPFIGPVPLFIPLVWCSLGYFCLRASGRSIVAPALLMVILDVSFDPIFSIALWHWRASPGPLYFGVPFLNFFGWFITSVIIFAVFRLVVREDRAEPRRTVVYSHGSLEGVAFYVLFGATTVLSQLNAGIPQEAAGVSALLYVAAAVVLFRLAKGARPPPR